VNVFDRNLVGFGQPASSLNGSDGSDGSDTDTGGNSLLQSGGNTTLVGSGTSTSGGGGSSSSGDDSSSLASIATTAEDNWPWVVGGVAVVAGVAAIAYFAHRKATKR
jgi:hypothetical protein